MDQKGQTALEYLLITVVALVVVFALFSFLNASRTQTQNKTTCNLNKMLCGFEECGGLTQAAADQVCRTGGNLGICGPAANCTRGKCVARC
jgi:hypothetical protein